MAEGNGEVLDESMKIEDSEKTEDYQKLIEYGLDEKVNIYIYYYILIKWWLGLREDEILK